MSTSGPNPPGAPQVKSLNCPGCGAALTLRSFNQAVTVVCDHCHSILDAQDLKLTILQKFKAATDEDRPLIPLGARGTIRGTTYEAIGFQRRTIHVDGLPYSWREYVLFNPYKGFRYLTEYNGHWNDTTILRSLPTVNDYVSPPTVCYLGETYRHFQTAKAGTSFVLGEFPWQVRVGESSDVSDYVSPPRVISSERTGKEITWSMGEYVSGNDIWKAFGLQGTPPERVGVYENQPSPLSADTKTIWVTFACLAAILVVMLVAFSSLARNEQVFSGDYRFNPNAKGEASFVTDVFELKGHTSDLELTTTSNIDNSWIYLDCALINQDTGQAYDFGREVSYYYGHDEDGLWTEGKQDDTVTIPSVPPGHYYLRVEPESDNRGGIISYTVSAKRDVPQASFFGIALLALLVPAGLITWRSMSFEHLRWAESDYAPMTSDDDDDSDDSERPVTLGNI
ncbi:MAG TPA: DUF4178 domain-containing protein [Candidatus Acidoferrum sp.]|nr:DUF4178 domain-containing protein [Candidatus Acidoferrum sp.]